MTTAIDPVHGAELSLVAVRAAIDRVRDRYAEPYRVAVDLREPPSGLHCRRRPGRVTQRRIGVVKFAAIGHQDFRSR